MDISKERENKKIAIIIPAFKPDFLQQTLESISSQTCKNFRVYIGDDNSPYNLQRIVSPYINQLDIIYHKFEDNMGKQDLTSHWDRCIKLSHEPIIWLFSDDDMMPKDGIARIMEALATYGESKILLQFPLSVIDENNNILFTSTIETKQPISGYQFLLDKLNGKIQSAACEFVFSRDTYEKNSGFVKFPMAWCSDDATWVKFAEYTKQIIVLSGNAVLWRNATNKNISNSSQYNKEKFEATLLFIQWIIKKYANLSTNQELIKALERYLYTIIRHSLKKDVTLQELYKLCKTLFYFNILLSCKVMYKHFFKVKLFHK